MRTSLRVQLISVLAVVAVPCLVRAQPQPPGAPAEPGVHKPMRVGAKVGLNSATMSVTGDDGQADSLYERSMTFAVGGVGVLALNDQLSVQGEALYIRKGAGMDLSSFGEGSGSIHLDYLEVPVLARYDLGDALGTGPRPFVYGGAALALFVSMGVEVNGEAQDTNDDDVAKLDLSIQVGGGVEIPMSSGTVAIDARYSHGLINADSSADSDANGIGVYHRVLSLFAGFLF